MTISRGKPLLIDSLFASIQILSKTKKGDKLIFHGRPSLFGSIPFLIYNRIFKRNLVGYQPHTRLRPNIQNKIFLNTFFDKVFCLTKNNYDELSKYGIKNCTVIPNPIPLSRLKGIDLKKVKKEYDVVWAGRDAPCKRLDQFIVAIKANPNIRALILSPKLKDNNLSLIKDADNITYIEGLDGEAFFKEFVKARALAFTSDENEGFPILILESLYLGIPIICSDFPKYREICGSNALYFCTWDEMVKRILEIKAKRVSLSRKKLKSWLFRFMPDNVAKLYENW